MSVMLIYLNFQVVSVTAPRKIIDMEMVTAEGSDAQTPVRDTKRVKQILLELERVCILMENYF
jgi:hypothetical protein